MASFNCHIQPSSMVVYEKKVYHAFSINIKILENDIDVFLEPLVDDLHTLLETGVDTYDASTKDNFNLRAVVLWTTNDYPTLGTLCGCPYSGFKEKNVAESLVGTLLNVSRKTKDGVNARLDLVEIVRNP
nr:hypothetical protein [Tanacetum cinerariifolium]